MRTLRVANPAINDLEEIWNFIAQDSPEAADRVERELYEAMRSLCESPSKGHERKDVRKKTLRLSTRT